MPERNIPEELRNDMSGLNLTEKLEGVTGGLATNIIMGHVEDNLAQIVPTPTNPLEIDSLIPLEVGMALVPISFGLNQVGKIMRWSELQSLNAVMKEFVCDDKFETNLGEWQILIEPNKTEAGRRFIAIYSRNRMIMTFVGGNYLSKQALKHTLEELTKKALEPKKGIHWPSNPPNSDNGEAYGMIQGTKVSILALLADLGIPNLTESYPGIIYAFNEWLIQNNISGLVAYPALAIPLFLIFIKSSSSLGKYLGHKRDISITKQLPEEAMEYSYGKIALELYNKGLLRNIIGSARESLGGFFKKMFRGRK